VDHFKCYDAREADGEPAFQNSVAVLTDQFGTVEVEIDGPELFCNNADKNDEGILDGNAHLTCYDVDLDIPDEDFIRDVEVRWAVRSGPRVQLGHEAVLRPKTNVSGSCLVDSDCCSNSCNPEGKCVAQDPPLL
jgi:hypothetical protein